LHVGTSSIEGAGAGVDLRSVRLAIADVGCE
jgi:hypothetical protein